MAPKKKNNKKPPKQDGVPVGEDETPAELKTRANALVASGDHKTAMALLTSAISMKPDELHLYHSNRSLCALSLQDYRMAVDDANKCITLMPEWPKGYSRLGAALFFSGKVSEAAKAYAKGLGIDPTNEVRGRTKTARRAPRRTPPPQHTCAREMAQKLDTPFGVARVRV